MSFLTGISKEWKVKIVIAFLAIQKAICSHGRSYIYFTESLVSATANNCTFWARHWDLNPSKNLSRTITKSCNVNICTEMGIRSEMYHQRGTFFVPVASTYPFCGKYYYLHQIIQFIFRVTLSCYSQQHRSSRRWKYNKIV